MRESQGRRRRFRALTSAATAVLLAASAVLTATPASAATVYEITGRWTDGTAATVSPGEVITAQWRVNVNDDSPAPSNGAVDNVTATFTIEHGYFSGIPDACMTQDVTPVSSLSDDKKVMVCNFGTHDMGTALTVQSPVVADGVSGDAISVSGTVGGVSASLPEVPIVTPFGMDINWTNPSLTTTNAGASTDFQFEWTLNLLKGSQAGPASVSYIIDIAPNPGAVSTAIGCMPFSTSGASSGHPWSAGSHPAEQMANQVACSLTPTATPNQYTLTLSGIDYSPANVPTLDSSGKPLPTDRDAIASGAVVFRVPTPGSGSVQLQSSAPTYTAAGTTAITVQDDASNNTATKAFTVPGAWSSAFLPQSVGSTVSAWSGQIETSAGSQITIQQHWLLHSGETPATVMQACSVYDSRWMSFNGHVTRGIGTGQNTSFGTTWYYTGTLASVDPASPSYNPEALATDCDQDPGGWSTTPPADLSTVKATKLVFTGADVAAYPASSGGFAWYSQVTLAAPAGTDIWKFDSFKVGAQPWAHDSANLISPTPGLRYSGVNAFRDVVRIVSVAPFLQKSSDRSSVRPGESATFTLNYAANGGPGRPLTVDDYVITDTLPVGMTYVEGSASPAPSVSTDGSGQQVLTWMFDGVTTNETHALTYQAVVGSGVTPGQTLVNTANASVAGHSYPASSSITVPTSGYTSIGKSADTAFIPNLNGDGVGAGSWTVTLRSFDPVSQAFTDTIDILPYNGDGRGTSFAGGYVLTGVVAPGATVYYTDADPATLSDDPALASNGSAGSVAGNTVGWSTTMPAAPTAVRVIGPALAAGATQQFTVEIETDGVEGGDLLVNRAQARTGNTELVMRTSAPISVANHYSASLKKYVQNRAGEWVDANTVEEYPSYHVGETVPYRIVVTNTGQGTLTELVITDDLFPEGSFTIDELAPGAEQAHEFEIVLGAGDLDTVVNTACGTAATPADSGVPPTINCDPAGVEVEGEPTHVKSLISASPIGGGQWQIVYGIDVSNTSAHATTYTLSDELHFSAQVTVDSAVVTASPDGVLLADPEWNGTDRLTISAGTPLLGTDDEGYAAHHYEVTVIADVPLHLDGADAGVDPTACPAEGSDADQGFNNSSTMTDATGDTEQDQACAPIPSISIEKSIVGEPVKGLHGEWSIVYEIVVANDGSAATDYTLTDRLRFGTGITVKSANIAQTPDGVVSSPTWTGRGAAGSAENVVAKDELGPGAAHTYRVQVTAVLDTRTADRTALICPAPGAGDVGGFANTAGVESNDLAATDDACAVPEWPAGVTSPLASTGGELSVGVLSAAGVLLLTGAVLLFLRRRRVIAE